MNKNFILVIFLITICLFQSCVDKIVVEDTGKPQGKIIIGSEPQGAEIYLLGTNTNKVTPDSIEQLNSGEYDLTLKKENYRDTTLKITVYDSLTTSRTVVLKSIFETGNISIQSEPAGAEIFLDSVNTNNFTPDTLKNIIAGEHKITLKKENYRDTSITVSVKSNETTSKLIVMTSLVKTGNIFVASNPAGALILLDSINTGKITPDTLKDIEVGEHKLSLKKNDYIDTTVIITVQENLTISKSITLSPLIIRGNIYLESQPYGAQIYIDSKNTNKVTPDTLFNYPVGIHSITLKKNNYRDTTFQINVIGSQTVSRKVILTSIYGKIFIQSNPTGAEIYLSDNSTGKTTPDTIKNLLEGTYKITLKYPEYNDTTFYADVYQNRVTSKNITLVKKIEYGTLFIRSNPSGAGIYVDNNNTGKYTPDTIKGLVVGNHYVLLKLNGYFDASLTVNIQKNSVTNEDVTLTEKLPIETDTLYYEIILLNQTRFIFSFNQDIILDSVDIIEPPPSNFKNSFDFGELALSEGKTQPIYIPKYLTGDWQFIFYGKKVDTGRSFKLSKTLTIP